MIDPEIFATFVLQPVAHDLCDDGTHLAGSGRNAVSGGSVSGREDFTWNNESSGVGTKVLEKVAKTVESEEAMSGDDMIPESNNAEENGKHNEAE